ncbi:hypothetical protein HHI36_023683 [Cryptolaemus montrouzieri]|uniref:Uncharacterized protein n=1 Tax=Cryptolaemus montrouzieri TaxID=559131 RepID=A0ABD2PHB6_9CUCU
MVDNTSSYFIDQISNLCDENNEFSLLAQELYPSNSVLDVGFFRIFRGSWRGILALEVDTDIDEHKNSDAGEEQQEYFVSTLGVIEKIPDGAETYENDRIQNALVIYLKEKRTKITVEAGKNAADAEFSENDARELSVESEERDSEL